MHNAMLRRITLVKRRGKNPVGTGKSQCMHNQLSGTRLYSASPPLRIKANITENTWFNKLLV